MGRIRNRSFSSVVSVSREEVERPAKSGRTRRVQLSRRLRSPLREHWAERNQPAAGERVLRRFNARNCRYRHFDEVCAAGGRAGPTPKNLRDTPASWRVSLRVPVAWVSEALGHSSWSRYDSAPRALDRRRAELGVGADARTGRRLAGLVGSCGGAKRPRNAPEAPLVHKLTDVGIALVSARARARGEHRALDIGMREEREFAQRGLAVSRGRKLPEKTASRYQRFRRHTAICRTIGETREPEK